MRTKLAPPRIDAPCIDDDDEQLELRQQFVYFQPWLTTYSARDEREYTPTIYDYRLRWTLEMNGEYATALCEVWSVRNAEWHQVWRHHVKTATTYGIDPGQKACLWQGVLDELACFVSRVLLND